MSDQSIVEVTQADRAEAFAVSPFRGPGARNRFLGGMNDTHPLVQAFARHRIAEREACAKVAEKYGGDYESATSPVCRARRNIAAAIRARGDRVDDISYAGVK